MKMLRFDSVGGASGDMILGALIDLGVDPAEVRSALACLPVESFDLRAQDVTTGGQRGTQVTVHVPDAPHPHRRLADIRALIEGSDLPPEIQANAVAVFARLAEAEAAVHGVGLEDIHFHEVGAMDAIVDIVGACWALNRLDVDAVILNPLPLGRGATRCAHGVMPLPVPATAALLEGFAVRPTDEPYELVTPTGAALLTTWAAARPAAEGDACVLTATGVGIGHRVLNGRPNILRATVLQQAASTEAAPECCVLETNLDDTTPELVGGLTQDLLDRGALDVFTTPVFMKHQRPGILVTVICRPDARTTLIDLLFAGSTTFGVREHRVTRTVLARRHEQVTTPYGVIRIKVGRRNGRDITRSPEYRDCVRCAREHHVPVRAVYEAARGAANNLPC